MPKYATSLSAVAEAPQPHSSGIAPAPPPPACQTYPRGASGVVGNGPAGSRVSMSE